MTEETGWLIEHPLDPRYGRESWYSGKDGFEIDSLKAVRFARKEDAVREIDRFPVSLAKRLIATQHAWVPPMPRCEVCDANAIKVCEWCNKYEHLEDMWRLIGESLNRYGHQASSEDTWPSCVDRALFELQGLRQSDVLQKTALIERAAQTKRFECLYDGERALRERDEGRHTEEMRRARNEAGQSGYDRALADIGYTVSVGMIAAERRRQVEGESWNSLHDDGHVRGELALAAACYAIQSATLFEDSFVLQERLAVLLWPWSSDAWKPGEPIRNLVKAGALIAAEIDRRLRAGEDPK